MGNCTVANKRITRGGAGDRHLSTLEITMSNSYATNGDALNLKTELGLVGIDQVLICSTPSGYLGEIDLANNKLKGYTAADTEIANTTDMSAKGAFILMVIGY